MQQNPLYLFIFSSELLLCLLMTFLKFLLLWQINALADFPSGRYKARLCCSNVPWKVRFGLNPERKVSL